MTSRAFFFLVTFAAAGGSLEARPIELQPSAADEDEAFERTANGLQPGDELILHGGTFSQTGRRAITVRGTAEKPIIIRASENQAPVLTHSGARRNRENNIEFVDCAWLVIRGLRFEGGSSGVRFIRGHHITFEDCEISGTGNNALTMNSGNCHAFVIRRNHIHHTGLAEAGATEGEGMYIGCHPGSCQTSDSLIEGNHIHHLRGTSDGGNDGIEIKAGSFGNIVRNNVIHDTNIGRRYPGIFVYGGGAGTNLVEGNVIWNAGEGIQVVSDAVVRNNVIFNCAATGITAAPHAAVREMRQVTIVNNTVHHAPVGTRIRWQNATNMVFANNAVFCPGQIALDVRAGPNILRNNFVQGELNGIVADDVAVFDGGEVTSAFVNAAATNFWPRPGSRLVGHAEPRFAPRIDFNGDARSRSPDVGAYESSGKAENPGWIIRPEHRR